MATSPYWLVEVIVLQASLVCCYRARIPFMGITYGLFMIRLNLDVCFLSSKSEVTVYVWKFSVFGISSDLCFG